MISIKFNNLSSGYSYHKFKNNGTEYYYRGVFIKDTSFLSKDEIKNELFKITTVDDINNFTNTIDGHFHIVINTFDSVFLIVDRLRSMPLFFNLKERDLIVYDHISDININDYTLDCEIENEFLLSGFTTGNNTLLKEFKQVEAGTFVIYKKNQNKVLTNSYFDLKYTESDQNKELLLTLHRYHIKIFKNIIKFANGRQIVVPLSGGYDSRLIVYMLHRLNYRNVICFTFGKNNNKEANISKQIANKLDYRWFFVEYNKPKIVKNRQFFKDFMLFSSNYSSAPHLFDPLAVKDLISTNSIESDAIFIPGHSYDFLAGSHGYGKLSQISNFSEQKDSVIEEMLDIITSKHYSKWNNKKDIIRNKLKLQILDYFSSLKFTRNNAYSYLDNFNLKQRQSKYIVNSIRSYDYFQFRWLLPFWNKELIDFWIKVPSELKNNRSLFFEYFYFYFENENKIITSHDNDQLYFKVLTIIRSNYYVNSISKRSKRLYEYFYSPLHVFNIIPLFKYLSFIPKGFESFVSIVILLYLDIIKKNIK